MPTVDLNGQTVDQADIYVTELDPSARKKLQPQEPMVGYVAEGIVKLIVKGEKAQRIVAGESFSLTQNNQKATIVNVSALVPAKLISFHLK